MFQVLVITLGELPTVRPPLKLSLNSGGEVRVSKSVFPDYPEKFVPGEFLLVVQMTELGC